MLLESQGKRSHKENIVKEAPKTSGLATEFGEESGQSTTFYVSNIDELEALVELEGQSDKIY